MVTSSQSARISADRPFYAAHARAYDLLVTDPIEPWVEFVDDARLNAAALAADRGFSAG